MNFCLPTAKNRTGVFTHPPKILRFIHCRATHTRFRQQNSTKLWVRVSPAWNSGNDVGSYERSRLFLIS